MKKLESRRKEEEKDERTAPMGERAWGDKDEEEQDERCDKGHRLVEGQRWPRLCVYVCVCVCELARPCPFSCRKMHSIVYGLHSAANHVKLSQSSQVKPILAKGERHTRVLQSLF